MEGRKELGAIDDTYETVEICSTKVDYTRSLKQRLYAERGNCLGSKLTFRTGYLQYDHFVSGAITTEVVAIKLKVSLVS